jgi:hypothetical protein
LAHPEAKEEYRDPYLPPLHITGSSPERVSVAAITTGLCSCLRCYSRSRANTMAIA